jgi:hypothetical protein
MTMARITHKVQLPSLDIYRVDEPDVNSRESVYKEIQFKPGDSVQIIDAGGCAQTGGHGKTWKRWVNPSGPNSDMLYHGLILIPGMPALARVQDVGNKVVVVPDGFTGDLSLHLGYEDDDYGDNGYWGHDDGTEDQCKNSINAYVEIMIQHKTSTAVGGRAGSESERTFHGPGSWLNRKC